MFENIIAEVLNRLLGSYVSPASFQSDRVSTSVYKGHVLFTRLELRTDSLDRLLLPITLKKGLIMKTEIFIPWTQLGSKPVEISLEGVYLLINPKAEWTDEELDRRAQAAKFAKLAQAELMKRSREAVLGLGKLVDGSSPDSSFTTRLISRITDNVEIKLKNVHIRFEDVDNFCFGLTLESLTIQTTDENWVPRFKDVSESKTFKLCKVDRFSVYGDSGSKLTSTFNLFTGSDDYFINFFAGSIPNLRNDQHQHFYLLKPMDGDLRITFFRESPLTKLEFYCNSLDIRFEAFQLENLLTISKLLESSSSMSPSLKYGVKRPSTSPMQDPKLWWNYALSCILKEIKQRKYKWSKSYFSKRRRDRLEYTLLWKRSLVGGLSDDVNRRYIPLSAQDKVRMEWLEKCLEFSDILLFRSYAENELRLEKAHQELWELGFAKGSTNTSFATPSSSSSAAVASRWISWALGTTNSNLALKESLSQHDVERFLALLRHNPAATHFENKDPLPEAALSMSLTVRVAKGSVLLPPIRLSFVNLQCGVSTRVNNSLLVTIEVESFHVFDGFQKLIGPRIQNLPARKRTRSATADELDLAASSVSTSRALLPLDLAELRSVRKRKPASSLFELSIDTNRRFDIEASFTMKLKPLEFLITPSSMFRIEKLLSSLPSPRSSSPQLRANSSKREAIQLTLEVREAVFSFLGNDNSELLGVEIGKLTVEDKTLRIRSKPVSSNSIDRKSIDLDRIFDEYEIKLSHISSWVNLRKSKQRIVDKFDVRGCLFRNAEPQLSHVPNWKVAVECSEVLNFRISKEKIELLSQLHSDFKTPTVGPTFEINLEKSQFLNPVSEGANEEDAIVFSDSDDVSNPNSVVPSSDDFYEGSSEFFTVVDDNLDGNESLHSVKMSDDFRRVKEKKKRIDDFETQSFYTVDSFMRRSVRGLQRKASSFRDEKFRLSFTLNFSGFSFHYYKDETLTSSKSYSSNLWSSPIPLPTRAPSVDSDRELPVHLKNWFEEIRQLNYDQTDDFLPQVQSQKIRVPSSPSASVGSSPDYGDDHDFQVFHEDVLPGSIFLILKFDKISCDLSVAAKTALEISIQQSSAEVVGDGSTLNKYIFHTGLKLKDGNKLSFQDFDEEPFFGAHLLIDAQGSVDLSLKTKSCLDILISCEVLETWLNMGLESNRKSSSPPPSRTSAISFRSINVNLLRARVWLMEEVEPFCLIESSWELTSEQIPQQKKTTFEISLKNLDIFSLHQEERNKIVYLNLEGEGDIFARFFWTHYHPSFESQIVRHTRHSKSIPKTHTQDDVAEQVLDSILGTTRLHSLSPTSNNECFGEHVVVFHQGDNLDIFFNSFMVYVKEAFCRKLLRFFLKIETRKPIARPPGQNRHLLQFSVVAQNVILEFQDPQVSVTLTHFHLKNKLFRGKNTVLERSDVSIQKINCDIENKFVTQDLDVKIRSLENRKIRVWVSPWEIKLNHAQYAILLQQVRMLSSLLLEIPLTSSSESEFGDKFISCEFSTISFILLQVPTATRGQPPNNRRGLVLTRSNVSPKIPVYRDVDLAILASIFINQVRFRIQKSFSSIFLEFASLEMKAKNHPPIFYLPAVSSLSFLFSFKEFRFTETEICLNHPQIRILPENFHDLEMFFSIPPLEEATRKESPISPSAHLIDKVQVKIRDFDVIFGGNIRNEKVVAFNCLELSFQLAFDSLLQFSFLGCSAILKNDGLKFDGLPPIFEESLERKIFPVPFQVQGKNDLEAFKLAVSPLKLHLGLPDILCLSEIFEEIIKNLTTSATKQVEQVASPLPSFLFKKPISVVLQTTEILYTHTYKSPCIRFLFENSSFSPSSDGNPSFWVKMRAERKFRKDWEFLVEDFTLYGHLTPESFNLICDDHVNINLPQNLLELREEEEDGERIRNFVNLSGLDIVRMDDPFTENYFCSVGDLLSFRLSTPNHHWNLHQVSCPRPGKVLKCLAPEEDDDSVLILILEVQSSNLILRTPLKIKNESAQPLELAISAIVIPDDIPSRSTTPDSEGSRHSVLRRFRSRNQHQRLFWNFHLSPNEATFIPANIIPMIFSSKYHLLVRPHAQVSGAPDYTFAELKVSASAQQNHRNLKKILSFSDFGSFSSTSSDGPYSCNYILETKWLDSFSQCLIFSPPIFLVNRLNCPVSYRLFSESSSASGQLPVGAELKWHGLLPNQPVKLALKVDSFEWSEAISIESDGKSQFISLVDDAERVLKVEIGRTFHKSGRIDLTLSVCYWLLNQTQLPLLVAAADSIAARVSAGQSTTITMMRRIRLMHHLQEVQASPESYLASKAPMGLLEILDDEEDNKLDDISPLMLSGHQFKIRFWDSRWSDTFNFDHSKTQIIECKQEWRVRDPALSRALYVVSATVSDSGFEETKVITLLPRFILVNSLNRTIRVRQWRGNSGELSSWDASFVSSTPLFSGQREGRKKKNRFSSTTGNGIVTLMPGEQVPFHWRDKSGPREISICFDEFGWEWGSGIKIEDCMGEFCSRLRNRHTQASYILRVDVQVLDSSVIVTFRAELPKLPPYRIDNLSLQTIKFHQLGSSSSASETLLPYHSCPYTWDLLDDAYDKSLVIDILERNYGHHQFGGEKLYSFFLQSSRGPFRFFSPSTWFEKSPAKCLGTYSLDRNFGVLNSSFPNVGVYLHAEGPTRVLTISDSRGFQPSFLSQETQLQQKDLPINSFAWKINFRTLGISLIIGEFERFELLRFTVRNLSMSQEVYSEIENFTLKIEDLQIDNQLFDATYPVLLCANRRTELGFEDFMHIQLVNSKRFPSLNFLKSFVLQISPLQLNLEVEILQRILLYFHGFRIPRVPGLQRVTPVPRDVDVRKSYVENLKVNPILMSVNFRGALQIFNPSKWFGAHVEGASLYLREFHITHTLLTASDPIAKRILSHYVQSVRRHWLVLISSVNLLGDPVGLARTSIAGFGQAYAEILNSTYDSPKSLVFVSVRSLFILVKAFVVAFTNSFLNISNGVCAALEFLASSPYREYSSRSFPESLFQGVAGVGVLPFKGYERDGMNGFLKGSFSAVLGVLALPLSGGFRTIARVAEAIRSSVDPTRKVRMQRERTPRFLKRGQRLVSFDAFRAQGEEYLFKLGFEKLTWSHHFNVSDNDLIILTDSLLIAALMWKGELFGLRFTISRMEFVVVSVLNDSIHPKLVFHCVEKRRFSFLRKFIHCDVKKITIAIKLLNEWRYS